MKVYLAGAIFGTSDAESKDWRQQARSLLPDCVVLDPMVRDFRGQETEAYNAIVEGDKLDIDEADMLLVYYEKPSVGTSMEILYAWERGKRVILVTTVDKISPWLLYHSHELFTSVEDAAMRIQEEVTKE